MARRLVVIPVLPKVTESKAATFWVKGGGAAKARCFEPRNFSPNQAPATPAEVARRNFLRFMRPPDYSIVAWLAISRQPSALRKNNPLSARLVAFLESVSAVGTRAGRPRHTGHTGNVTPGGDNPH